MPGMAVEDVIEDAPAESCPAMLTTIPMVVSSAL
jgi:hypothetical protein